MTEPDTTALRALADRMGGAVSITAATAYALCDGYDEAQRLRDEVGAADLATAVYEAEANAARQALADLIGELRGACDERERLALTQEPGEWPVTLVHVLDLRAVIDRYDPDLFQCVHCEQYRDVNDGTDSVAGMGCHDCAGRP